MRHAIVQVGKNTVTKTAEPSLMRVEVEKTCRAFEIGKECGLFRVPRVLDFDDDRGTAVFELVKGVRPFISRIDKSAPFADRVGRSLAIIHRDLNLPSEMAFPLPQEFTLEGNEVFFHGDFNGENICLQAGCDPIVILDWQMTCLYGGKATYGSRYFDLVYFINFLIWKLKFSLLFSDPVIPVAGDFLKAYFKETGTHFNAGEFALYAANFFEKELTKRKHRVNSIHRYLFFKRSQTIKERFLRSLNQLEI